jgi:pSer/pThr/pTyr-binding forkhead associated (FHA) protein
MPYLQLRDSRYPLARGDARVGRGEGADIRLPIENSAGAPIVALISLASDGVATVRSLGAPGSVLVNGVQVGQQPAPLLHGDRMVLDGCELRFADEAQLGETIDFPIASVDSQIATPTPGAAEARTDGRLLSLVDGREYPVGPGGLSIGRDASCDLVITSPEVSRRHAEIRSAPKGFALLDRSTNGVLVNGKRVWAELALGRGDMIRIGREEFRFYAEGQGAGTAANLESVPSLQVTAAMPAMKRPVRPPVADASPPASELKEPLSAAEPKARNVLATLEIINEGPTKGKKFDLLTPLSNVGRGDHNDVIVRDESVSESHAKIQRRDDGWYAVDMGSTNGTYVNGERISSETRIGTGADIRFGGVKTVFRPAGGAMRASGGTRVIVGLKGADPKRVEQRPPEAHPPQPPAATASDRVSSGRGTAPWLLTLLLVVLITYTVYLVVQGR